MEPTWSRVTGGGKPGNLELLDGNSCLYHLTGGGRSLRLSIGLVSVVLTSCDVLCWVGMDCH